MSFWSSNGNKQLSDRELVERFRYSYDSAYIGELFQRYTPLLFGICLRHLQSSEKAKDAVMDVFAKVVAELRKHDVLEFKPWVCTVARNHCLMDLRKDKTATSNREEYGRFLREIMESEDAVHLNGTSGPDLDRALYQAIDNLKDSQRQCIRLFYFEKKSYEEIQQVTGFSFNEVKSHLQNGKRNLRIQLTGADE